MALNIFIVEYIIYKLYFCSLFSMGVERCLLLADNTVDFNCMIKVLSPPADKKNTVEPGYNVICLYDTSYIASDILWYQLIPHC
jgi:hypothetical protein